MATVEYDYPAFRLIMDCFWCCIAEGEPVLTEHDAMKWLATDDFSHVQWLPADLLVIEEIEKSGKAENK